MHQASSGSLLHHLNFDLHTLNYEQEIELLTG